jgi:hypothetical protein
MSHRQVVIGSLLSAVLMSPLPALAEKWKKVEPSLVGDIFVDVDSLKTGPDGSTYWREKRSTMPGAFYEMKVNCGQDFSAETIEISKKAHVPPGVKTPDADWTTRNVKLDSMGVLTAKYVCHK